MHKLILEVPACIVISTIKAMCDILTKVFCEHTTVISIFVTRHFEHYWPVMTPSVNSRFYAGFYIECTNVIEHKH